MINALALILGTLVLVELIALVARRAWVHWKRGKRAAIADEALTELAEALVTGTTPAQPAGRVRRRAFRLAALELFPELAGDSHARLTGIVEELGLVDDVKRTLQRSPRAFARRTAADELAEIRSLTAARVLAAALDDRDAIVRVTAVRGLTSLHDLGRLAQMRDVLDRDSQRAPSAAASAMLDLARVAPEALANLEASGRSPFARRFAALALARVGDERALPSLLAELASTNALLSSVALRAITRVGGDAAVASLEEVVRETDRDPALREQAQRALERVRS
jgi:HEAT repeat protein